MKTMTMGFAMLAACAGAARVDAADFHNSAPIAIPGTGTGGGTPSAPASPYPSPIVVSGQTGTITGMMVTLHGLTHSFTADIDMALVGPNGQAFLIMADVGGNSGTTGATITISDAAELPMPAGPLVTGVYRPTNLGTTHVFPAPGPASVNIPEPQGGMRFSNVFGGIDPNGTWNLYVVDDAANDAGVIAGGWTLTIFTTAHPRGVPGNFDGDAASDFTIQRNVNGSMEWHTLNAAGYTAVQWGHAVIAFDAPDRDGDGRTDREVCNNFQTVCYTLRSSDGAMAVQPWGDYEDKRLVMDLDGDGKDDHAVYRDGLWYVLRSSNNTVFSMRWGNSSFDRPLPGDWDGDGRHDFVIVRPENGGRTFYMLNSTTGFQAMTWGTNIDLPIPGDFDGDGRQDVAVARTPNGGGPITWYIHRSSDGGLLAMTWGVYGAGVNDNVVSGDFDGDGKTDIAVYRFSDHTFYVHKSSDGGLLALQWGTTSDYPLLRIM